MVQGTTGFLQWLHFRRDWTRIHSINHSFALSWWDFHIFKWREVERAPAKRSGCLWSLKSLTISNLELANRYEKGTYQDQLQAMKIFTNVPNKLRDCRNYTHFSSNVKRFLKHNNYHITTHNAHHTSNVNTLLLFQMKLHRISKSGLTEVGYKVFNLKSLLFYLYCSCFLRDQIEPLSPPPLPLQA